MPQRSRPRQPRSSRLMTNRKLQMMSPTRIRRQLRSHRMRISLRADLDECRPWKLHVVKFQKNGTFAPQGMKKIVDICKHSPWILDIDEDYLSCQNPFTTEFTQLYGEEMYNTLVRIYQGMKGDDEKYNNLLE